ncbi:Zinc finger CCCH domain-containing protein 5 [Apostasia shenzhenica]|uniref:Zinc finger CCCH domain-containing protein 5 n=1 Tax=Apostasia shenzhenica TaxID=1088818 RepID=A0A2I0BG59_9ASPA|nr:Zinc finger CCCH domain-containing protein 5 [Apostasia shenzhenica]
MADPATGDGPPEPADALYGVAQSRKEKRKVLKKLKRKQIRKEAAIRDREEEEALLNDPEEQLRLRLREKEESERAERVRMEFEERERLWLEAAVEKMAWEDERRKQLEEEKRKENEHGNELEEDGEYEYIEEGPAEVIWQGNEIIVKKKRVKVPKRNSEQICKIEDDDRPTSNPLPPQSAAFASYVKGQSLTAQEVLESVAQQVPNFGTEQDKAHCPFHLKTGACRFGLRCSRVHFYPENSCTLLIKNMYNGPGLACEQDEGLEYTDDEVEQCYEEFYEDVHTEFLKFGELANFKVCKNSSYHLRGNVYVHYKSLDSAILAYNTMNGRFYAGKQIICEFVGVTRWKVAICGEYMKTRLKTCSHGSACNFIHCFRNPGGDYEWADWDNPPPRYWIKKMAVLFGPSVESGYEQELALEDSERGHMRKGRSYSRQQSGRSSHEEMDMHRFSSSGDESISKKLHYRRHSNARKHSCKGRDYSASPDKSDHHLENRSEDHVYSKTISTHTEVDGDISKEGRKLERSRRRTRAACMEERDNFVQERSLKSERKHTNKNNWNDSAIANHGKVRSHSRSNVDSISSLPMKSEKLRYRNYSSDDPDSEKDYNTAMYYSRSYKRRKHDKSGSRHHASCHRRSYEHDTYDAADDLRDRNFSDESSPGRWRLSESDPLIETS